MWMMKEKYLYKLLSLHPQFAPARRNTFPNAALDSDSNGKNCKYLPLLEKY
jgi:hypothetical protein